MYSVVLMAALSAGVESAPDCHRGGCGGCYGGCYGYSCGGCYGGGYSCGGCYGGGYGYSCGGCYGGGYGCYGGGYSCGGCYGGGYSCGGCYGGGCYGGGYYGGAPAIGTPVPPMAPPGEPVPPPKPEEKKETVAPNKAKLIVEVPADAKLYIDDMQTKQETEVRTFDTPTLETNVTYYYILKAEVVRDGSKVMLQKRVTVKAGEVTRAKFEEKADAVAAK